MKKIFLITYLFFFFISGICQNHIDSADCRAWLEKDISTIKLPIYYEHFTVKNIYISGNDIVFEGCVQDNVNVDTTTNNFTKVSHLPFYGLLQIIASCNILIDSLLTFCK